MNIISQIPVSLRLGDKECGAVILVQKGAALDLLLGTDLLIQLGFRVLRIPDKERQMVSAKDREEPSCKTSIRSRVSFSD